MRKYALATIMFVSGFVVGVIPIRFIKRKSDDKDLLGKMGEFYRLQNQWLKLKQERKSLVSYFRENNYRTVAIYGMKELGERLYDELRESGIEVKYIVDRNAGEIYSDVDVLLPEEELPQVDVIVVTAIHYYDEIERKLNELVDFPVVSLEDIIYEL